MAVRHLTQKWVDGQRPGGPSLTRDAKTRGLLMAVNRTTVVWKVQADLWRDRRKVKTCRRTLGTTADIPLAEARRLAGAALASIQAGVDPWATARPPAPDGPAEQSLSVVWAAYGAWMREQGRAERTLADHDYMLAAYLADWRDRPLGSLLKSHARERHQRLTAKHGPYPANRAMRSLRSTWNWAVKRDDHGTLGPNPAGGVDFNFERRREAVISPEDLPDWWNRVGTLPNPLRAAMHRLGLLSGLRPGTLVSLERAWIDLPGRAVHIPKMKSGRSFSLPLSEAMVKEIETALQIGYTLYRDPPWLFPTRANAGREVIATRVWKEKHLRGQTGYILRHTYRSLLGSLEIPQARARALMDHTQPGIDAHYLHAAGMRDQLLADQERISARIIEVTGADVPTKAK
jgi:integrase